MTESLTTSQARVLACLHRLSRAHRKVAHTLSTATLALF
jgi:hypothetical protein